jgi:SnoaL-like protein
VSTMHAPRVHVHRPHVNLWFVAVLGLAAGLIALGSWVLVDRYTGSNATKDATTLIDRFDAAFNARDANALAALMAPNVQMRSLGDVASGRDTIANGIASQAIAKMERVSPVTVNGEFATHFERYTEPGATGTFVSVFQIRNGKILRIWGYQPGLTAPFDNAVRP